MRFTAIAGIIVGYAHAIEDFDLRIPEILDAMADDDLLMITADHGNDQPLLGLIIQENMYHYWFTANNLKD